MKVGSSNEYYRNQKSEKFDLLDISPFERIANKYKDIEITYYSTPDSEKFTIHFPEYPGQASNRRVIYEFIYQPLFPGDDNWRIHHQRDKYEKENFGKLQTTDDINKVLKHFKQTVSDARSVKKRIDSMEELNERKLTKAEVSKREDIIKDMKKNKRELTKRYGKDAEKVMYGRATNLAKKQLENMDPKSKLREMIKTALSSPKPTNEKFSKKYDDDPALKGGQKNLPDALQKSIIDEIEVDDSYSERETMGMEYNQNPEKFLDSIVSILNRFSNGGKFNSSNVDSNYLNTFELEGSPLKVGLNKEFSFDLLSGEKILMSNENLDTILLASEKHSSLKEASEDQYPSFEVDKNIRYQDMNISSGYWTYTGKESGGRGVYLNVMTQQRLAFNKDDINFFKTKLPNHFKLAEASENQSGEGFRVEYKTQDGENAKSRIYKTKEEAEKKEAELVDKSRIKQAKIVSVDSGLKEDLDLGHQDDEPHMLKANLYRIGKYAMELYQMMDKFEGQGEVDLPHWWQSKIIKSESMITSAKHYLDFELKEPEIDAMVDVASEEGAISEIDNNDPILMKMRAAKDKKKDFGSEYGNAVQKAYKGKNNDTQISSLERKRNQLMRDMEQEAEPEGGPIADRYGRELNKIDAKISKLRGKPLTYDQAISESDSYVRVSKPKYIFDKNHPNFLFVNFKYDTGGGSSIALGKETMSGQIRRLSSSEAMKQATALAKDLEKKYNIEDIDVYDEDNGIVQIFAVSDDFINMDRINEINTNSLPSQEEVDRFFEETQNEMHYLASKPVMGQEKTFNNVEVKAWDEYDLSNWNALVRKKKEGRLPFGGSKYSQLAEKIAKNLKKKSLNEVAYSDPNTGKFYELLYYSDDNIWELNVMKNFDSKAIAVIKRNSSKEIIDWLEEHNIDSNWVKEALKN